MGIRINKEENSLDVTITDNLKDIKFLKKLIESWLENLNISDFKIMSVKLCLNEAVYNSILHAYKGIKNKRKIVDIHIEKKDKYAFIKIKDYGQNKWAHLYKPPLLNTKEEILKSHGRGIMLIDKLACDFKVKNKPNQGTEIYIKIDLLDKKYH